jgi:hypothetical protein
VETIGTFPLRRKGAYGGLSAGEDRLDRMM